MEGALGRFAEATWIRILDSGLVREYLDDNSEESWTALRQYAEELLEFERSLERELREKHGMSEKQGQSDTEGVLNGLGSGRLQPVFEVRLPAREQKRAGVLLEIQVHLASEHPGVVRFRRERLGGRLLSADDAEAYFTPRVRTSISDRELAALGDRLKKDYGWHRDDAAWFVLTGESPTLRPLAVSFFDTVSKYGPSYCEITLHVAPWVPSEEVEKAFVRARDQVRGAEGPGTVGEQRLEVLRFVEEQRAKHERRPNFEALLQMWNHEYPHWSYADYRALSKAYREARKEVIYPEYRPPDRAQTPNMKRQDARNLKWLEAVQEREARRDQARSGA